MVGKEEEKGESTPEPPFHLLCCNFHLLNEVPVPSCKTCEAHFYKLLIDQREQPSSLSFLPLQDSACHVMENLWDHSNSMSLPESHMTQQRLQCKLPMVVNKPLAWLCSSAMPCARCRRLADRSPWRTSGPWLHGARENAVLLK